VKVWIISDTHFGHEKMREYCNRPDNADERMLLNLAKHLSFRDDMIIHLGDFCIGNEEEWHLRFMETIVTGVSVILIRGNHDRKSIHWYLLHGWSAVMDRMDINAYGKRIAFSHMPLTDDGSFDLNIHGHLHDDTHREGEFKLSCKHVLVSIEGLFQPVTLKSILKGVK